MARPILFGSLCCLFAAALGSVEGAAAAELNATGFADGRGGTGGKVIRVTNLDADGPGSLRAAMEAKGPRIVVFEVGGVIDLGKGRLRISEPFVTVAGQSAPSPGITILRGGVFVTTHHVVVRHIRVRPGDAGQPKRSGWEPDAITTSGGDAHDIVIDHCSLTWAVDENLSASGPRTEGPEATSRRVTFSHSIIAEGLDDSSHSKGPHSKGSLIHDFCRDIAIVGNLYAHNVGRNPYFKAHTTGVIVNNVIYNPGRAAIQLGYSGGEWSGSRFEPKNCRVSIVGNVLVHGPDTKKGLVMVAWRGHAYLADNAAFGRKGEPKPIVSGKITRLETKPVWPEGLVALPAKEVVGYVVRHAGARPRDRDAVDKRIIEDFRNQRGRIIDSQDEVGGYPKPRTTRRPLDVPAEGVEEWLAEMARRVE